MNPHEPPIPLSPPDLADREADAAAAAVAGAARGDESAVASFEEAVAGRTGRSFGVAVASAGDGVRLALAAASVGPGDEVVTTPFDFPIGPPAARSLGATAVFADVGPRSLNLDADRVAAAITPRTKAILTDAAFGGLGGREQLEQLARRNELVLIDAALAGFGGRLGTRPAGGFGRAGFLDFGPGRPATATGGAVIVTDDDRFADACRLARTRDGCGMSGVLAAIGSVQIDRLDDLLDRRAAVVARYVHRLMDRPGLILPTVGEGERPAMMTYPVRLDDAYADARDAVARRLRAAGVACRDRFALADADGCPVAQRAASRTLCLPLFAAMTAGQVDRACDALAAALDAVLPPDRST